MNKDVFSRLENVKEVNPVTDNVKMYEMTIILPKTGVGYLVFVPAEASTNVLSYMNEIVQYIREYEDLGCRIKDEGY